MSWFAALRATLAALGAYYLLTAVALAILLPVQFWLPRFGTIGYPELGVILGIITAFGGALAAAVATSFGGMRGAALITALWAIVAATVIVPFMGEGTRAFVPPSDLMGIMPATVLTISALVGAPAIAMGAAIGARASRRTARPPLLLEAAGVYDVLCVLMSLPTPQLDVRLMLPFSAAMLPIAWHAVVSAVPAIATGLVLGPSVRGIWRPALIGAGLGLAGALPGETGMLTSPIRPYWPTSLVGVPVLTAFIVVVAAYGARLVAPAVRVRSAGGMRGGSGVVVGAAAVLLALAGWNLFAAIPSLADRDVRVDTYQRSGDERKIVVCVTSGRGEHIHGSWARETSAAVFVTVRLRRPPSWYFHDLVGIPLPVVVELRDPLGVRAVVDEQSGDPAREVSRTAQTPFGWC